MANTNNIVITLKVQNNTTTAGSGSSKDGAKDSYDLSALLHPVKTAEKAVFGKNIIVYQAYQQAKQQIISVAKYEMEKYFSLTENYTGQQAMDNALTTISKVSGFGTALASGATLGMTVGGPIGAIIGAAVGAAGYTASEAIQIYQRFDKQNRQLATMNTQSQFQMTRLGLVDGGRNSQN